MKMRDFMALAESLNEDVSTYDLKAKYDKFNRLYFEGGLPDIPITFATLKGVGGHVRFQTTAPTRKGRLAKYLGSGRTLIPGSVRMEISDTYKRSEGELDALLIHEMIHVLLISQGDVDDNHGPAFMAKLRELSEKSGINIPVSEKMSATKELHNGEVKPYGVFLLAKKSGGYSFAVTSAKTAQADLEEVRAEWARRPGVAYVEVYTVTSPMWSALAMRVPVQRKMAGRSLKLYLVSDKLLVDDLQANGTLLARVEP